MRPCVLKKANCGYIIDNGAGCAVLYQVDVMKSIKNTEFMINRFYLLQVKTWMEKHALYSLIKLIQRDYPENTIDWQKVITFVDKCFLEKAHFERLDWSKKNLLHNEDLI